MENKFRKLWPILFGIFLTAYSGFVLLDAFVIPSKVVSMKEVTAGNENGVKKPEESSAYHTPVITESSYDDGLVTIEIETKRISDTTVYIVDVKLADASYLKTALAGGKFARNLTETTSSMAEENNAILAINGDYYGFRATGYVMRGGYLYRSERAADDQEDLVLGKDGSFSIIREAEVSAKELKKQGAQEIFSFGPGLVQNSEITVNVNTEVDRAQVTNPRTAIGIVEPLHYKLVVSDGRTTESRGLSLYQLAEIMQELGCTQAYNLDGGGSSTLWFQGKIINKPTTFGKVIEERSVSDIVYIGE